MRSLFLKIFLWFWVTQILIGFALSLLAFATARGVDQEFIRWAGDDMATRAKAAAIAYEGGGKPSLGALRDAWDVPQTSPSRRDVPPENVAPDDGGPPDDGPGAPPEEPNGEGWLNEFLNGNSQRGRFGRRFGRRRGGPRDKAAVAFYALKGPKTALVPTRLVGPQYPDIFPVVKPGTFANGEAVVTQDDGTYLARLVTTPRGNRYMAVMPLSFPGGRPTQRWSDWFTRGPGGPWRLVVITLTMGLVCYALARYLTTPAIKLRRATQEFANGNLAVRVGPQMGKRRDELADLGRDFDNMAERIENMRLSERRLLGDISHELRSPLARMQVALDLADQVADDTTRTYLARIEDEAKELNVMINQLLTITRLENASPTDQREETVNLEQLVAQVCANADFEARSHGSKVEFVEKEPCQIRGNGQLLRSAIENVVRNAILHAPTAQGIQLSLQVMTGVVTIRVRDHGPGVPPEALGELFRPFFRVAEARDRQSGGVGLGLSITQRALQLHGGQVSASNAPDGGLIVEMMLPLSASPS